MEESIRFQAYEGENLLPTYFAWKRVVSEEVESCVKISEIPPWSYMWADKLLFTEREDREERKFD